MKCSTSSDIPLADLFKYTKGKQFDDDIDNQRDDDFDEVDNSGTQTVDDSQEDQIKFKKRTILESDDDEEDRYNSKINHDCKA